MPGEREPARGPKRSARSPDSTPADVRRLRILATVDAVPRGRVATYGQIAEEAGLPGRARLVGKLLGELPAGSELAWHRIVNAAGELRAPSSASEQRARLCTEGVPFDARGRVRLREARWVPD